MIYRILTTSVFLFLSQVAFGAMNTLKPPTPEAGLTLYDFISLLIKIIQAVGTPALVVSFVYAGYTLLTAGGNEEKISKAKVWIFWTLIGAAIVIGAQEIANMVCNTAKSFDSSLTCS